MPDLEHFKQRPSRDQRVLGEHRSRSESRRPDLADADWSANRDIYGNKGAGLVFLNFIAKGLETPGFKELCRHERPPTSVRVPAGFIIPLPTRAEQRDFDPNGDTATGLDQRLEDKIDDEIEWLTELAAKEEDPIPLLVSVRSGGRTSVPGLMSTVLNVGITPKTLPQFVEPLTLPVAMDTYRRFLASYGRSVLRISEAELERVEGEVARTVSKLGLPTSGPSLDRLVADAYLALFDQLAHRDPSLSHVSKRTIADVAALHDGDAPKLVKRCIAAVLRSARRPSVSRLLELGEDGDTAAVAGRETAVTVQLMVLGNLNKASGAGVFFTRDPNRATSQSSFDFIPNAQGDDVVKPETSMGRAPDSAAQEETAQDEFRARFPRAFANLEAIGAFLEAEFGVCEIEFVVENNQLWLLQFRNAKLSAHAAFHFHTTRGATNDEDAKHAALLQITASHVRTMPHVRPQLQGYPSAQCDVLSSGIATGIACFDLRTAERLARTQPVILIRHALMVDQVRILNSVQGLVTVTGWPASHVMGFARSRGVPVVKLAKWNHVASELHPIGDAEFGVIREGDELTIDGIDGALYKKRIDHKPSPEPLVQEEFIRVLRWADIASRPLGIELRLSTSDPRDIQESLTRYGISAVGLSRTEFFLDPEQNADKKDLMPHLAHLLADSVAPYADWTSEPQKIRALCERDETVERHRVRLLAGEAKNFFDLFKAARGHPVAIRLLDRIKTKELREAMGAAGTSAEIREAALSLLENDDGDLGIRGVRLGVAFPVLYQLQIKAILHALLAARVIAAREQTPPPSARILLPLVTDAWEVDWIRALISEVARSPLDEIRSEQALIFESMDDLPLLEMWRSTLKNARGGDDVTRWLGKFGCSLGVMIETPHALEQINKLAAGGQTILLGTTDLSQLTFGISQPAAALVRNQFDLYHQQRHERDKDDHRFGPRATKYPVFLPSLDASLLERAFQGLRHLKQATNKRRPTVEFGLAGSYVSDPATLRAFLKEARRHRWIKAYVSADYFELPVVLLQLAKLAVRDHLRNSGASPSHRGSGQRTATRLAKSAKRLSNRALGGS